MCEILSIYTWMQVHRDAILAQQEKSRASRRDGNFSSSMNSRNRGYGQPPPMPMRYSLLLLLLEKREE